MNEAVLIGIRGQVDTSRGLSLIGYSGHYKSLPISTKIGKGSISYKSLCYKVLLLALLTCFVHDIRYIPHHIHHSVVVLQRFPTQWWKNYSLPPPPLPLPPSCYHHHCYCRWYCFHSCSSWREPLMKMREVGERERQRRLSRRPRPAQSGVCPKCSA